MERDVNLKLIYIILILLLALGVTTIFYQMRYTRLEADYQSSAVAFNETLKNLSEKQKKMNDYLGELNTSTNREYTLISRLEKKTGELENTSIELAAVQQELFECQQQYDYTSVNYTNANQILERHRVTIGRMQGKIDSLRADVESGAAKDVLLQDIQQLQDELNNLKTY